MPVMTWQRVHGHGVRAQAYHWRHGVKVLEYR
jgi:hypothetical protein